MYAGYIYILYFSMQNPVNMPVRIHSEAEYKEASARLKSIYREIMKLVIRKEEYEEQISEYLKNKDKSSLK